jgi:hypothetical protein
MKILIRATEQCARCHTAFCNKLLLLRQLPSEPVTDAWGRQSRRVTRASGACASGPDSRGAECEPSKRTSEQLYNTLRDARDQVQVASNTAINQVAGALGSSLQGRESGPASHRSGQVQASRGTL